MTYFEDISKNPVKIVSVIDGMNVYHVYPQVDSVYSVENGMETSVDSSTFDKVIKLMENYKGGQNEEIK